MNKSSVYFFNNHLKHTCKQCGRKISLLHLKIHSLEVYAAINRVPQFCNRYCFAQYNFPKGERHPAYKNGTGKGHNQKFSKPAILTLGGHCERCGTQKHLYAHHKDHNPRNNIISNISVLCRSCHNKLHWEGRKKWKNTKQANRYYKKIANLKRQEYLKDQFEKKFGTRIFYRATDICRKCNICRERIRQLRNDGRIEYLKIGGTYMYADKTIKPRKEREKECLYCQKVFKTRSGHSKFCSRRCQGIMYYSKKVEELNKNKKNLQNESI